MLNVTSEIGPLRRVVVHSPGEEVRLMTPALRHDLLFDDILYLDLAKHEHAAFRKLLLAIGPDTEVLDAADLLRDILKDEEIRRSLVDGVCRLHAVPGVDHDGLRRELLDAEPGQLAAW